MPEVETLPFVDTSGEYPEAVSDAGRFGRCYGSSTTGGECETLGLSFENIDEWRAHRREYHPVGCGSAGCSILSAYKRDNAPSSYCFEHVPDDPDPVYAWRRTNEDSVVEPPRADEDHPVEAALRGLGL